MTDPVTRLGWFIIGTLYGLKDRRVSLRDNMERSLAASLRSLRMRR